MNRRTFLTTLGLGTAGVMIESAQACCRRRRQQVVCFSSSVVVRSFREGTSGLLAYKEWYREPQSLRELSLVTGCDNATASYADRFRAHANGYWEHSVFFESNISVFSLRIRYGNALDDRNLVWRAAGMTWRDGLGPGNCRHFTKSGTNPDISRYFRELDGRISDISWEVVV